MSLLDIERCLHHSRNQALIYMPFDVAAEKDVSTVCAWSALNLLEEPDSRIVSLETEYNMSFRVQDECISSHRNRWILRLGCICWVKTSGRFLRASDGLKIVTMKVERMLSGVCWQCQVQCATMKSRLHTKIVDNNVNDLIFLQDERMDVLAIHKWVFSFLACAHCSV